MKTLLQKAKNKAVLHKGAVLGVVAAAAILYAAGFNIKAGWLTYCLQLPALAILAVTALARVNDISSERTTWIWQLRRVGLSFVGVAAVSLAFSPWSAAQEFPAWREMLLIWGFALTWISTPGMPPFWKYVSGEARLPKAMT
jgi:hypothetical protein